MTSADPWQTAEVAGPKKAAVITRPAVVKAMIGHARHPVILLGNGAVSMGVGNRKLVDYLLDLSRAYRIPVIATGHINKALVERGFTNALVLPAVGAGQRIADPCWEGPEGKGPCDLAIIAGLPYPMAWTLLSGLKNFAPHLKTITLDTMYHPNAGFSFANISVNLWQENLAALIQNTGTED